MASTPHEPPDPEDGKLELPRLGGLLRRRGRGARDDAEVTDKAAEPAADAADPELVEVELGSEADDEPPATPPAETAAEPTAEPGDEPSSVYGPELVAPATAYTEGEPAPGEPTAKKRWRPSLPSMPSLPSLPDLSLPLLEDRFAAPLTGLLVGLLGFVLTFFVQAGCGAVRGADTCGGAGLPLLIVIVVLMVFAGSVLLRAWYVDEPLTTSFLAVALVAVVAMVLLLPVIDRWFMVIVIPVLSAAAYWLSWWVTSRFDAPEQEAQRERENAR